MDDAAEPLNQHRIDELERQVRLFDTMLYNLGDNIGLLDREKRFVYANRSLEQVWGLSRKEYIGMTFSELGFPPDSVTILERQIDHVFASKEAVTGEIPYTSPIGVSGYWRYTFSPIIGEQGEVEFVAGISHDLSERKRAEEALRTSEALLQGSIDALPDHIAILDRDGVIIKVNKAWQNFAIHNQYTGTDYGIGSNYIEACVPPQLDELECDKHGIEAAHGIRDVITGKLDYFSLEYPCHSPTEFRWFLMRVTAFGTDSELRVVVAHENVTTRHLAEEALRESEERFRSLVTASAQVVWITDAQGAIPFPQASWGNFTGQTYEVYSGWGWLQAIHPDDQQRVADQWRHCLAHKSVYEIEYRLRRYDGVYRDTLARGVPMLRADGTLREWIGQNADITERKQAEAELRESQAHLQFTTEAAQVGTWQWNIKTGELVWSVLHKRLWGYEHSAMPMSYERWSRVIHPDDFKRAEAAINLCIQGLADYYDVEYRITPEGTNRVCWIRSTGKAHVNDAGEVYSMVGISYDITERKRAEAERERLFEQERQLRAQAEEASRLKDEFLATVSHELRTPLTAFLGYAQLLQSRKRDEAYVTRTIDKMVRSAKDQAQLIEDLLDVSRIVSGKLRIEPTPIDFTRVIGAALDTVRPAIDAKGLHLEVDLSPEAGTIIGDANRLLQVVWNLLSNATKFTPPGGSIRLRLVRHDQEVELTVSDTGQGIRTAFLPYVFDRFRQADSTSYRAHGGLGLGLAIVRHLVELHGGTVQAASAGEGQGSTFTVRLPLYTDSAGATVPIKRGVEQPVIEPSCPEELQGLRVLVVDDQLDILELLHDILIPCGAIVRMCNTARDALDLVRTWKPDVLVSDIAMPSEDGYWLISKVRALAAAEGGSIPAAALTAYVRMEERLRVLASGYQLYLTKPVEPAELRDMVARLAHLTTVG